MGAESLGVDAIRRDEFRTYLLSLISIAKRLSSADNDESYKKRVEYTIFENIVLLSFERNSGDDYLSGIMGKIEKLLPDGDKSHDKELLKIKTLLEILPQRGAIGNTNLVRLKNQLKELPQEHAKTYVQDKGRKTESLSYGHKVLICYSKADYLSAYCDALELYARDVEPIFPEDYEDFEHSESIDCDGALCYISKDSRSVNVVAKQLSNILKNHDDINVIWINLDPIHYIGYQIEHSGEFDYRLFDSLLPDKRARIQAPRKPYPEYNTHIDSIIREIDTAYYTVSIDKPISRENRLLPDNVKKHPNEDAFYCPRTNEDKIFIVADGITRNDEHRPDDNSSISG